MKTINVLNVIEDVLIGVGIAVSLTDIQQILSIIILVFNVCWILFKVGYKIYEHVKTGNIKAIGDEIKTGADELQTLSDSLPKEQKQEREDSEDGK